MFTRSVSSGRRQMCRTENSSVRAGTQVSCHRVIHLSISLRLPPPPVALLLSCSLPAHSFCPSLPHDDPGSRSIPARGDEPSLARLRRPRRCLTSQNKKNRRQEEAQKQSIHPTPRNGRGEEGRDAQQDVRFLLQAQKAMRWTRPEALQVSEGSWFHRGNGK